jgi:hypothetical protein
MARVSAFRGTWQPNARPYVTLTPDVYVAVQGQTSVTACGECNRQININDYITGISTEASVDSPPGSSTINLCVPDNDVNNFYIDGQFIIVPMMEIEIYAKGYYLIGGFPQYYKIFWGLVQSVTKDWSGGTTTISIQNKDILRWWELTNQNINPSLVDSIGSGGKVAGNYSLFQNTNAGLNPYTTIMNLAKESMGDWLITTSSFADNTIPTNGAQTAVIGSFVKDIMTYWALKFANIWSNLVMYGMSGQAYSTNALGGATATPNLATKALLQIDQTLNASGTTPQLAQFNLQDMTTAKQFLPNAGNFELTQNDIQTKLTIALQARDQLQYEFFCDPSGSIVFKPPLYNLNVQPNQPVSWVNDFEIIDDSMTDTEAEVYTHAISTGNAFGGPAGFDPGISDDVTATRTGVYDFHLLRRYGFRQTDFQTEWASNSRMLFNFMLDYLDRINAKRQNGTITIPMRPELKLGFPVWVPGYDSYVYVTGLSHQFSVGGQATTTITWIARRQKFYAPDGLGTIALNPAPPPTVSTNPNIAPNANQNIPATNPTYVISFPSNQGANSGITQSIGQSAVTGSPNPSRNPTTGQFIGAPNVVMVFKSVIGNQLQSILQQNPNLQGQGGQNPTTGTSIPFNQYKQQIANLQAQNQQSQLRDSLKNNRYNTSMVDGFYDYATDSTGTFTELGMIPVVSVQYNPAPNSTESSLGIPQSTVNPLNAQALASAQAAVKAAQTTLNQMNDALVKAQQASSAANAGASTATTGNTSNVTPSAAPSVPMTAQSAAVVAAQTDVSNAVTALQMAQQNLLDISAGFGGLKNLPSLTMQVRPVSDENGFEVVGIHRYGRGCMINQGLVVPASGTQSQTSGQTANQVSIQFAAVGGILTDTQSSVGNPLATNFAAQFEQMQPAQNVAGGSYSGSVGPGQTTTTNASNYSSSATMTTNPGANVGSGVFVDADALRGSVTLGELTPTSNPGGLSNITPNCACALDRADWLSILPTSFIQAVLGGDQTLSPVTAADLLVTGSIVTGPGDGFVVSSPTNLVSSTGAVLGTSSPTDFFSQLDTYLATQFTTQYQQNANRELQNTGQSFNYQSQLFDNDNADAQSGILGLPTNPLFGPAGMGDPTALSALQGQVNFNFGLGSQAVAGAATAFQNALAQQNQSVASQTGLPGGSLTTILSEPVPGPINVNTSSSNNPVPSPLAVNIVQPSPQVQPVTVQPVPNINNMILNPTKNTILSQDENPSTAGTTPGQVTYPPTSSTGQS